MPFNTSTPLPFPTPLQPCINHRGHTMDLVVIYKHASEVFNSDLLLFNLTYSSRSFRTSSYYPKHSLTSLLNFLALQAFGSNCLGLQLWIPTTIHFLPFHTHMNKPFWNCRLELFKASVQPQLCVSPATRKSHHLSLVSPK